MFRYGFYGFYWDPTYWLVVIGALICLAASAMVKSTFHKYSRYQSQSGMTGAQAAERIFAFCRNLRRADPAGQRQPDGSL